MFVSFSKISLWNVIGMTLNWSAILLWLPTITIFKFQILFSLNFHTFSKDSTDITNVVLINESSVNRVFWRKACVRITCSSKTLNICLWWVTQSFKPAISVCIIYIFAHLFLWQPTFHLWLKSFTSGFALLHTVHVIL